MCWKCGKKFDFSQSVFRESTCPECGADLHCCRGCRFYSPGNHYDCRETVEDFVAEKTRANFCEHFSAGENASWKKPFGLDSEKKDSARSAFDALFS